MIRSVITRLLPAVLFVVYMVPSTAWSSDTYTRSLEKGIHNIEKKQYDSAVYYLVKAYSEGLSRDSLLYFWANIHIQKLSLDSALAANYMVSVPPPRKLTLDILVQRSTIYKHLGWRDEAAKVIDTIRKHPSYRSARTVPDVKAGVALSFSRGKEVFDTASPWNTNTLFETTENTFSGSGYLDAQWKKQLATRMLKWGLHGALSRKTSDSVKDFADKDSMGMSAGVNFSIAGKILSSNYSVSIDKGTDDSVTMRASIDGGMAVISKSSLYWAGVSASVNRRGKPKDAGVWVYGTRHRSVHRLVQLQGGMLFDASWSDVSQFSITPDTIKTLYARDGALQYPVFYTDHLRLTILDTGFLQVVTGNLRNRIIASSHDTVMSIAIKQPFSSVSIMPKAGITFKFRLPLEIGCAWKFSYFTRPFEWDQGNLNARYLMYSEVDNSFYTIPWDLLNDLVITYADNGGLALAPQATKLEHHRERRIDNSIMFDISQVLFNSKRTSLRVHAQVSRTWSTLSDKSPFAVPSWNVYIGCKWDINLIQNKLQAF
ncbi:MAG: hypothetical protein GX639_15875 [Fibrobacter sp.]|nr:hypothetical protein [Fibrobacter sp.]